MQRGSCIGGYYVLAIQSSLAGANLPVQNCPDYDPNADRYSITRYCLERRQKALERRQPLETYLQYSYTATHICRLLIWTLVSYVRPLSRPHLSGY